MSKEVSFEYASSNAIQILNQAQINFLRLDFSNIKIPHANL